MKNTLLTVALLFVCAEAQAEEYTTLQVSEQGEAGAATGDAAGGGQADAAGTANATATTPPPAVAPAPMVDPLCATVTCSGQGTCSVQNGRPMCACNAGFMPGGADGLSCLPYTPPAAVMSAGYADPEREASLKLFYSAMPNFPAERYYAKYAHLKQYGRFTGTFIDYMGKQFAGKRGGGIAMLSVGVVLSGASAAFLTIGANAESIFECGYDDYYGDYESCDAPQIAFFTFGSLFAVASVVMYSVGIPSLIIGNARKHKMDQLAGRSAAKEPAVNNFRLSLMQDPKTGTYGLGARFNF